MKHDTHFKITGEDAQVKNGDSVDVECGQRIERAQVQPIWDDFATGAKLILPAETVAFCRKCAIAVMEKAEPGPRKIWAISRRREDAESSEDRPESA